MTNELKKELEKVWNHLNQHKEDPDYSKFYPLWRDLGNYLGKHSY